MSEQDLKSHIESVHSELEIAHEITPHERDLLGALMEEIVVQASQDDSKKEELSSELDRYATNFETTHPKLAGIFRQIMDTLAKMGI